MISIINYLAKYKHTFTYATRIKILYFFLLIYVLLALGWWGTLLFRQSKQIVAYESQNMLLRSIYQKDIFYKKNWQHIQQRQQRRVIKIIGEGLIFLSVILVGASWIYRAIQQQVTLTRQQQNFMMTITHELKSPITSIKLNLETLQRYNLTPNQQQSLLASGVKEMNRLDRLCHNILLATHLESDQYELFIENFDLSAFLTTELTETQKYLTTHQLITVIHPHIFVQADKEGLRIVTRNLIENAIKYAADQTSIIVRLTTNRHKIIWKTLDQGPGIPLEEKEKIFQKFYRIGSEATRQTKGSGLGLFLVKKIIAQHQGQIWVRDNHPKGSCFEINLPYYM